MSEPKTATTTIEELRDVFLEAYEEFLCGMRLRQDAIELEKTWITAICADERAKSAERVKQLEAVTKQLCFSARNALYASSIEPIPGNLDNRLEQLEKSVKAVESLLSTPAPVAAEVESKELVHRSNHQGRARDLTPERVFADEWERTNKRHPALNGGYTTLELILARQDEQEFDYAIMNGRLKFEPITQRDATVAAEIIQWLGTDSGKVFIDRCEQIIAEEHKKEQAEFHQRVNVEPYAVAPVAAGGGETQ